jgi:hypothetical protein
MRYLCGHVITILITRKLESVKKIVRAGNSLSFRCVNSKLLLFAPGFWIRIRIKDFADPESGSQGKVKE